MKKQFDSVAYRNEYAKEKYDRMTIIFPKGTKNKMSARAAELGYITKGKPSVASYLYHLYQADVQVEATINLINTAE